MGAGREDTASMDLFEPADSQQAITTATTVAPAWPGLEIDARQWREKLPAARWLHTAP
jgi:hypothetical protein